MANINFEVIAVPTLAKGTISLGYFMTASDAIAAARRMTKDWPVGSFKLQIREVPGD